MFISYAGTGEHVVLSTAPECPGTHWYQCRYSPPLYLSLFEPTVCVERMCDCVHCGLSALCVCAGVCVFVCERVGCLCISVSTIRCDSIHYCVRESLHHDYLPLISIIVLHDCKSSTKEYCQQCPSRKTFQIYC
jgi:hypothetical protein